MVKSAIPVYDICFIDQHAQKDLLIERFGTYLEKHYHNLHRPHRHSFYHLVLFTQGKGTHSIDFNTFPVQAFQMYFMAPAQVHSWHFKDAVDGYIVHFNETFFSSFLQDRNYLEAFGFFSGDSEKSVCKLKPRTYAKAVQLFESMLLEKEEKGAQHLDMIRVQLLQLFILVNRECNAKAERKISQPNSVLLRRFQQLIHQHYRSLKLPKDYADLLYVTPNYLNALCMDLLGKTAGDLIRGRVLLEAKRMLTNADMTVAEIAYDLHFKDNSYFNRFFKNNEGITPDAFRKNFIQP